MSQDTELIGESCKPTHNGQGRDSPKKAYERRLVAKGSNIITSALVRVPRTRMFEL